MLQISGLTARYQDKEVLRDITFDITAGQFVVIRAIRLWQNNLVEFDRGFSDTLFRGYLAEW